MKKLLVGFIMDGKSGGIDKYLLNFLTKVSNEEVRIDFLTNEIDVELQKELKKCHSNLYAIANLKHPVSQYRQVCRIMKEFCRLFLYRYGTEFYGCSVKAGEWLFPKKIVNSSKFCVIHNAVDREKYRYSVQKREEIRGSMGITDQFVIGHVGNFCYQKNHYFLLDVFEEVHKKDPNTVLLLAGDGVRFEKVRQIVAEKNLEDVVKLLGRRSDTDYLYQGMDAFLLPSNFEGLPIAGIEAQSAGLPCFMSDEITKESKITEACYFIPLKSGAKYWAEEILDNRMERQSAEFLDNVEQYDLANQDQELKSLIR